MLPGRMLVTISAFALLRDTLGFETRQVEVPEGTTALDLYHSLVPAGTRPPQVLFAVDMEYVSGATVLTDGCELALVPPLGGG